MGGSTLLRWPSVPCWECGTSISGGQASLLAGTHSRYVPLSPLGKPPEDAPAEMLGFSCSVLTALGILESGTGLLQEVTVTRDR